MTTAAPPASTANAASSTVAEPAKPAESTTVNDTPPADFTDDIDVNNDLPTEADLAAVADLLVLGPDGSSHPFRSLYSGEGIPSRVLVIFVRHFFCGNCQEYLRNLAPVLPPADLLSLPTPTFITIVGCGRPDLIPMYTEATACPFPIYADPSRKLYDMLGMSRTLNLGQKPDYIKQSMLAGMGKSILQGLKMGRKAAGGGDVRQVGGEMLFENGRVVWCHRMKNTRDHAEVDELKKVLGTDRLGKKQSDEDAPPLAGGPVQFIGNETHVSGPSMNGQDRKEFRRRSVDLRSALRRMSGEWGRRSTSSVTKVKDFQTNGTIPEDTKGDHRTETSTLPSTTESPIPAPTPAPTPATNGTVTAPAPAASAHSGSEPAKPAVTDNSDAAASKSQDTAGAEPNSKPVTSDATSTERVAPKEAAAAPADATK